MPEQKAQVYKRIQSIFEQSPFPAPAPLLHLFLSTLAKRDMEKAVVRVLQDYSERPALVKKAILYLHYQKTAGPLCCSPVSTFLTGNCLMQANVEQLRT